MMYSKWLDWNLFVYKIVYQWIADTLREVNVKAVNGDVFIPKKVYKFLKSYTNMLLIKDNPKLQ